MSDRPRSSEDKLLEAWHHAAQAAPSPALDAAVLHAARAELAGRAQAKQSLHARPWWLRWAVPVSVTAVAVLGLSLSLRVADENELRLRSESAPAPAARPGIGSSASSEAPAAGAKPAGKAEAPEKAGAPEKAEAPRVEAPRVEAPRVEAPKVEAPKVEAPKVEAPVRGERAADASAGRRTPSPAAALPGPAPIPEAADGSAAAEHRGLTAPSPAAETPDARQRRDDSSAVAPRPPSPATAPPMSGGTTAAAAGADSTERRISPQAFPSHQPVLPAGVAVPRETRRVLKSEAAASRAEPATPEAWVEELRVLLHRGQEAQVRAGLRQFQARYPDFPLPPDLAALQQAD